MESLVLAAIEYEYVGFMSKLTNIYSAKCIASSRALLAHVLTVP